ncbi:MAG: hypothetical protein OXE40_00815 [Gammaproteobacteria bacterium]|nr:hypothetical protein [Gammaproteobacteria bacterium]
MFETLLALLSALLVAVKADRGPGCGPGTPPRGKKPLHTAITAKG